MVEQLLRTEAAEVERFVARVRLGFIPPLFLISVGLNLAAGRPEQLLVTVPTMLITLAYALAVLLYVDRGYAPWLAYLTTAVDLAFVAASLLAFSLLMGRADYPTKTPFAFLLPAAIAFAALRQSVPLVAFATIATLLAFLVLLVPAALVPGMLLALDAGMLDSSSETVGLLRVIAQLAVLSITGTVVGIGVARTRRLVTRALDTVTFLFADLRDYTSYIEARGDTAGAALVQTYRRLVRSEIARTGGREVKTEGDSFLVAFPSARQAIECAVGILRAAAAGSPPIPVGIGLNAGEPVMQDGDYIGSAVNVAARLCQHAGAGELLVSDVVRGLVRTSDVPLMRERGGLVLKGIADPPRVYEVAWS